MFVHGLRGHRRNTWTKDGVFWPEALLSNEPSFSRIRILSFGYDANVVKLMGRASLNNLFEHSLNLLNELSRKRRHEAVSSNHADIFSPGLIVNSETVRLYSLRTPLED